MIPPGVQGAKISTCSRPTSPNRTHKILEMKFLRRDRRGRPAKSVEAKTGTITKKEEQKRRNTEKLVRGKSDKLKPPTYLTRNQKKIFRYIIAELDESKLLGNLDLFILSRACVSIDQLQNFDKSSNEDPKILLEKNFRLAKDSATKDFFRCCSELCLSPQSRAKLSIAAANQEDEKKTLMDILNEEDDEET